MAENPQGVDSASEPQPAQPETEALVAAPMPPPPTHAPLLPPAAWGTAAPAAAKRRNRWLAIALIVIFAVSVAGGAGAFAANSYLSDTYSPQRAVLSYFTAQGRGDVDGMMSNATFLRGDGSYEQFFDRVGVRSMMDIAQNRDISEVKILATKTVSSESDLVDVSMMWAGTQHIYNYTVSKDASRTNYFFYSSWRVDIPYTTITITLPPQPGAIELDGMPMPESTVTSVQAIAGFHAVTMLATPFYDATLKLVDGVDASPVAGFDGTQLSPTTVIAAGAAIRAGANACDAAQYSDCPGHTYRAPNRAGWIYFLTLPGYPEIDYTTYAFKYSGDITSGMKLAVPKDEGLMYATGTCAVTLTVNGSRTYRFTGTWGATLTWANGAFTAEVFPNCEKAKG